MQYVKSLFRKENLSAIFPWAVVSAIALSLMVSSDSYSGQKVAAAGCALLVYIVFFLLVISDHEYRNNLQTRLIFIAIQYAAIMILGFLTPFTFLAILVTIWSAQLPYFMPFKQTLFSSPIWTAPFWLVMHFYWQIDSAIISTLLFWTFNIFALVMVNANIKEKRATEQAMELNRELMATQTLLGEASKQAERVRIARNIHDLLGHHLTALTINLQVASRISDGEVQSQIQQCHDLAKLLLSDVREAVSEIREKSHIELNQALHALLDNVPNLRISLNIETNLTISDVDVAETILRCVQESVTNTLRHSHAKNFNIQLSHKDDSILLRMQDDGSRVKQNDIQEGNGLTGMRERVAHLGGTLDAKLTPIGFHTQIELPELT
ncbi:histidine kinase [Aliiglaciecola sp. 3_MG-2023]|uniref:sensor histidine kinase n=1 Tax=Aliiglaciecola sp. 3_MG-2023 TaxID=3062644 RepID=UPI0026E3CC7C|nr:histidine kinase [Aliiglaciecola sp. 3_MG-2023]MDO6692774.1 histidine kinase [Aliiglaciecola sp. 3_MG-2023]